MAELINRAASSAEIGVDFTGGGVISFSPGSGEEVGTQRLTVILQPKEAVDKGAASRVVAGAVFVNAFVNAGDFAIDLVHDFDYTVEFNTVSGWLTPTNFPVNLPAGQNEKLTVTYERAIKLLLSLSEGGIFVSGPVGMSVGIEFTPVLPATNSWTIIKTIPIDAVSPILAVSPPWTNGQAGFYRARTIE